MIRLTLACVWTFIKRFDSTSVYVCASAHMHAYMHTYTFVEFVLWFGLV